jgi:uncharacterized protein with FMN-binding domain
VRGCDIHDVEDGVYISTTDIDLKFIQIGIQLHRGVTSDVTIRHNSVSVFPNPSKTGGRNG